MMKVVILNGNKEAAAFDEKLLIWAKQYPENDYEVEIIQLRDLNVKYCTGCWGCWVKTPGQCVFTDDSALVCKAMINADLVVFASPVKMGFVSSLLKKSMDKMIPLVHPYIEIVNGENHHQKRYEKYPELAVLLETDKNTDDEDIEIITNIFKRLALNFKSDLKFVKLLETSEVAQLTQK
ncbi:MAG: flavodoxin family protein [Bacteroidetes bacterium]|nr:flavodoxin family protein [Bacteroidota bacterium]